jgi:hypothetical protein
LGHYDAKKEVRVIMALEKQKLILSTGKTAWIEYDQNGDLLEIIFRSGEATCAIELTESIILRFDWETSEPLSLSFISFSQLIQPTKYGQRYFQLLTSEWPAEIDEQIWTMLRKPPLSEFLTVNSYEPAFAHQVIPMTNINPPHLTTLAA